MSAIFWGSLSHCETYKNTLSGSYSCSNRTAYGAFSAFAVLVFLCQVALVVAMYMWQHELIYEGEATGYTTVPGASSGAATATTATGGRSRDTVEL